MKRLFWLSYRQEAELVGVVIIEARNLLEARMIALIEGIDRCADFAEGYELSAQEAAMISAHSLGRLLPPTEVNRLIAWIESEAARKSV